MFEDMHDKYCGDQSQEVSQETRVEVRSFVFVNTGKRMDKQF